MTEVTPSGEETITGEAETTTVEASGAVIAVPGKCIR
jgi:hypothetical protein